MESISSTPQQTVTSANSFLAAYREANVSHSLHYTCYKNRLSKWTPPVAGMTKINFDGSVLEKGCEVDGEIAEALAAREAVDLAINHGWRRVLIEWDCLSLINKLNSSGLDLWYIRPLIQHIKLATPFCSCS
ncbi:UNVERIFIED_CONTAM: hypothetical protein Sindi_0517700 [Sesamum indicum]